MMDRPVERGLYWDPVLDGLEERQWFLDDPRSPAGTRVDPRSFTVGKRWEDDVDLTVPVGQAGHSMDWTYGAFHMPVVTEAVAEALRPHGNDIQLVPVSVEDTSVDYYILNVTTLIDAINPTYTEGLRWTEEDERPDKLGGWKMVVTLVLDAEKTEPHQMQASRCAALGVSRDPLPSRLRQPARGVWRLHFVCKPCAADVEWPPRVPADLRFRGTPPGT